MSGSAIGRESDLAGRRFVFLSHVDFNLYRFRLPIMERLVALGARVYAVAPPWLGGDRFSEHGVEYIPLAMRATSLDPVGDARVAATLSGLLTRLRPDVLQTFMLKPNLIGGWVARRHQDVRVISTVTGLGRLYEDGGGLGSRLMRASADQLMRLAFARVSAIVFQNPDDREELLARRLCRPGQAHLILSSGIDLDKFSPASVHPARAARLREQWGIGPQEPVITMVARLLSSKGVREFAAAARALRGRARLVLIGPIESDGWRRRGVVVPGAEVAAWQRSGTLIAPGGQGNIEEWLAMSDAYALPSYYREGVPRSVLEALAMGLPVVTTDMPGCRETVEDGENGFLIPPRDVDALVAALSKLAGDPALRRRMGEASRALAKRRFSSDTVAGQHVALYRELLTEAAWT